MAKRGKKIVSEVAYALIQCFKTIFLMQNAVCKFEPSCSCYAKEAIEKLPLHLAMIKIVWRVLRCNPFSKGGFDPIDHPPPTHQTISSVSPSPTASDVKEPL